MSSSTYSGESDDQSQWSPASPDVPLEYPNSSSNSPSQQVPQSSCPLTKLVHSVGIYSSEDSPELFRSTYLKIVEQPQSYHKFRYLSEMENSHGCLYGETYEKDRTTTKSYPEVELINFNGKAKIRCELVQFNKQFEHPHRLIVNNDNSNIIAVEVPLRGNYHVRFQGMSIIYTPRKDVKDWIFRGHDLKSLSPEERSALPRQCKNMAKLIDLNRLRLKFSAIDLNTGAVLCDPVYSNPIHNLKNAATNMLKICRMSRCCGRACGGDDVIMLVEKVMKKNIMIRFFQKSEDGTEIWSEKGLFTENDVHHQYAIAFRTPPYKDKDITKRVSVFVELVRQTDGQKSAPKEFFYTPGLSHSSKKRKFSTSNHLQMQSIPLDNNVDHNENYHSERALLFSTLPQAGPGTQNYAALPPGITGQIPPLIAYPDTSGLLPQGLAHPDTLSLITASTPPQAEINLGITTAMPQAPIYPGAMTSTLPQGFTHPDTSSPAMPQVPFLPDIHSPTLSSAIAHPEGMQQADVNYPQMYTTPNFSGEDFEPFLKDFGDIDLSMMFTDLEYIGSDSPSNKKTQENEESNDQVIIKKIVKRLLSMIKFIRIMDETKKDTVAKTLKGLFDLRLSNGDTFLHVILISKQPLLDYVINLVSDAKMSHLLNLRNQALQTILHIAVVNDLPELIPMLLEKGCDPMIEDIEGNNAIHYAVMHEACLESLLNAIVKLKIPYDLEAYNNEWQTALHLAVVYKSESSARRLLSAGGRCSARDAAGRTPTHLAAADACLPVLRALLEHVPPEDIDEMDDRGYTVLQIICEQEVKEGSLEIIKLLLEKKADPTLKRLGHNTTAWGFAWDKPGVRDVMRSYLLREPESDIEREAESDDDVSDDEFESADEGDMTDDPDDAQAQDAVSDVTRPLARLSLAATDEIFVLASGL